MSGYVDGTDVVQIPTRDGRSWDVVVLRDDDGRCGYGEASDSDGDVAAALAGVLDDVTGMSVDQALDAVAAAAATGRERLPRLTALGGVETALCDLAARRAGVALSEWLDEHATRPGPVRMYANINRCIGRPDSAEFADVARRAVDAGFRAVKCAPFDRLVADRDRAAKGLALARAVRSVIGPDVDLMIDVHFHLSVEELHHIAPGLAELGLRWLEDAIPLTELTALRRLRDATGAPIAGGELLASAEQASAAVRGGVCDVLMPDVKYCGGVRRALAYARHAQQLGAEVSLHNPSGPVATAASAHVSRCVGAGWLEYAFGELPDRAATVVPPESVRAGSYVLPTGPGLGLDLVGDEVQERSLLG